MLPTEEVLTEALYFDKNFNACREYEDAWAFTNTRKGPGIYNPVAFMKAGMMDAVPAFRYKKTALIATYKISKGKIVE